MKIGDKVFVYHSGKEKAVVGFMEIMSEATEDPKNQKSSIIKVKFLQKFKINQQIILKEIKDSNFNNRNATNF